MVEEEEWAVVCQGMEEEEEEEGARQLLAGERL